MPPEFPLELKLLVLDELRHVSPRSLHPTMSLVWPDTAHYIRRAVFQAVTFRSTSTVEERLCKLSGLRHDLTPYIRTLYLSEHSAHPGRLTNNPLFFNFLNKMANLHTMSISGAVFTWIRPELRFILCDVLACRISTLEVRSSILPADDFSRIILGMTRLASLSLSCLKFMSHSGHHQRMSDFPSLPPTATRVPLSSLSVTLLTPTDGTLFDLLHDDNRCPVSLEALQELSVTGGDWNGAVHSIVQKVEHTLRVLRLNNVKLDRDLASPMVLNLSELHFKFDLRDASYGFAKRNLVFDAALPIFVLNQNIATLGALHLTIVLYSTAAGVTPTTAIQAEQSTQLDDILAGLYAKKGLRRVILEFKLDGDEDVCGEMDGVEEMLSYRLPRTYQTYFKDKSMARGTILMSPLESYFIPHL